MLAVLPIVVTTTATAGTGILIEETFIGKTPGAFNGAPSGKGKLGVWRGPVDHLFGSVEIITDDDTSSSVLAIRDTGPDANQGPSVRIDWPPVKSGDAGTVVVEFKYKTLPPASDADASSANYRTDIYIGGAWAKAIATIVLERGRIGLHDGKKVTTLGRYIPNRWQSFHLEVDTAARTFSLKIDDRPVANKLPWVNQESPGFSNVSIRSDMSPTARNGEIVLLLSDLKVSTQN
ncbi:hypothetical protein OPIT5_02155 [Opitutaceae bacterium TAV5]|nr:hypothetical protein OPIT5_02155 [Opitutaceae bacterium TAV5]